jgi:hypothetical protein
MIKLKIHNALQILFISNFQSVKDIAGFFEKDREWCGLLNNMPKCPPRQQEPPLSTSPVAETSTQDTSRHTSAGSQSQIFFIFNVFLLG